ncbi:MAG: hypothetical protein ACM3Q1_09115 [Bacteroidales bacterium]
MDKPPPGLPRFADRHAFALLALLGVAAALAAWLAGGAAAAIVAGASCLMAGWGGMRWGRATQARADQLRLYRVSDELVQYRAFTQLLRAQGERIVEMSGEAALALAVGLREMDERAGQLADALARGEGDPARWRQDAVAIAAPVVDLVGRLQFQDVTRQQLGFLARLSLILDDHMAELGRSLGDRRSLDRTSRFKELFEQALDDTVMTSQRNDHHRATGVVDLFEDTGPAIEMFGQEEEAR